MSIIIGSNFIERFSVDIPSVEAEKQVQFEKDAAAFNGLPPWQQEMAVGVSQFGYTCRSGLIAVNDTVMNVVDQMFDLLLVRPCRVMGSFAAKAWQALISPLKGTVSIHPSNPLHQVWQVTAEKMATGIKKLGAALDAGALSIYCASRWALNPRWSSGEPLFGSEAMNKIVGISVGIGAFTLLAGGLSWMEVMGKVWHAEIAHATLVGTGPLAFLLAREVVSHTLLTAALTVVQFPIIPAIAAARQTLKATQLTKGIAYQYNLKIRMQPVQENKTSDGWKPSAAMKRFFHEIVEKTSPEFYKARLKYYRMRWEERKTAPLTVSQTEEPVGKLGDLTLEPGFNEKAAPAAAVKSIPSAGQTQDYRP